MITVRNGTCLLCREDISKEKYLRISTSLFLIHLKCWRTASEEKEIRNFDTFSEWKEFAGDEWDLTKHISVDLDGTKRWYFRGMRHREDGPAIEWGHDRAPWWYLDGEIFRNKAAWKVALKAKNEPYSKR